MCLPGVDQTGRSPPRWNLMAPRLEQQQALPAAPPKRASFFFPPPPSPHEFLKTGRQFDAFGKLARVAMSAADLRVPALPSILPNPAPASHIEMLATELVDMITTKLSIEDQIALALCSTTLWCHVLYHMHTAYYHAQAPWAGTPILCTSTYLVDLPEPMRTLVPEVYRQTEAWHAWVVPPNSSKGMSPARSWNWQAISKFTKLDEKLSTLEEQYHAAFDKHVAASAIPQHIQDVLKPALNKVGLQRKQWKLRNLDTRELVRFEATATDESESQGVNTIVNGCSWLTLDFVLIARICWTCARSDHPGRQVSPTVERLERGVWAGNCFDVVEDVQEMPDAEGWRDVTEEIIIEVSLLKEELARSRW